MDKNFKGYKEKELVKNDLKHSGDSIDKLRIEEDANIDLAAKEIGQVNENL
ncbi:hypothetical protein [Bacillus massiliigorillae]|uniref:hypothetical protein n=1 Tax=Bacillus massiliigorillae TaxID=1243664 RepID=UPI0003A8DC84|nr:hypothetical protein [Bacillus massiliigorillae]